MSVGQANQRDGSAAGQHYRPEREGRTRRRVALTLVLSLLLHGLLLWLLVTFLVTPELESGHRGSYFLVSPHPPSPDPPRAQQKSTQVRPSAQAHSPRQHQSEPPPPSKRVATPSRPAREVSAQAGTLQPGPVQAVDPGQLADGNAAGLGGAPSLGPVVGSGAPAGSTNPSPECLDGLDNDGDRLTDHEDPQCWPGMPEAEYRNKHTGAQLRSAMRQNDLQRGDPEQLARLRIRSSLQPDGDSLVYRRGSFIARIGPDGEVSFSRTRRVPGLGLSYETDRGSPQFLEMRRFLDATEDIRAEREARAGEITMRRALAHLGSELNELWRDSDLSVRQKKEILFQRLAECNLDTAGGREAAQIIVNFIRHHFRSVGG